MSAQNTPCEFAKHIGDVARVILGEPNRRLSRGSKLRYGTHGSLSVDCEHGRWFDNEKKTGGGVLDFLQDRLGLANGAALSWLEEHGFSAKRIEAKSAPSPEGRAQTRGALAHRRDIRLRRRARRACLSGRAQGAEGFRAAPAGPAGSGSVDLEPRGHARRAVSPA